MENVHFYFPLFDNFYIDIYREGVLMNEQLLKMNGLSVKILDMLSFESHLGMGYEFTTENIQTYLNDVAGVRIVCAFIDEL